MSARHRLPEAAERAPRPGGLVLYTLAPEQEAPERLRLPVLMRLSFALGNLRDQLRWRRSRQFGFRSYRYERFLCSNRGDAAVRAAIAGELARHLSPQVPVRQLRWGSLTPALVEEINRSADLMVIAGGGYLAADRQGDLIPRCRRDLALLERLRVPLVSFGIGLNVNLEDPAQAAAPRLAPEAEAALARFVSRHSLLGVRDRFTQARLAEAAGQAVRLVPDPVFFLEPGPALRRERLATAAEARPGGAPTIGLNLAFHGALPERNLTRNFEGYLAILKRLRARTGCRFVYFQHADAERVVYRLLRREGLVAGRVAGPGPADLLAAYGRMDLVISEMMHAAIMPLSSGTPVVSIGYDIKHRALFELLGLKDWLVDTMVEPLDTVEARALAILGDAPGARARLGASLAAIEPRYAAFVQDLCGLLAGLGLGPGVPSR